jgi:hypothetical protein
MGCDWTTLRSADSTGLTVIKKKEDEIRSLLVPHVEEKQKTIIKRTTTTTKVVSINATTAQ